MTGKDLHGLRFLTDIEVAQILGVSVATVRRWRLKGEGPEWSRFGACVRYSAEALNSWAASRLVRREEGRA